MRKKSFVLGILGLLMSMTVLAGCGSAGSSHSYAEATADSASGYAYSDNLYGMEEMAVEDAEDFGMDESSVGNVQDNRKLIKNVNMDVETEEFDKLIANVEKKINALGGYAERKDVGGRSYYNADGNRYANIVVRIPSDRLDEFVSEVAEQSNVTSKNESTEDVTLQYADVEAHRDSLRTEQTRLNVLLAQAEDLETIIALEERLTEVRYQLESYESQLRAMENQVDYSTVYLYITEVERLTPQVEKSPWEQMRVGFAESVYKVGVGLQKFCIQFVIAIPYLLVALIVVAVIVTIVLIIVKAIDKSTKKRQLKMQAQMQQRQAQQQQTQPSQAAPKKETKE